MSDIAMKPPTDPRIQNGNCQEWRLVRTPIKHATPKTIPTALAIPAPQKMTVH
jgi:hypothetical protein